MSASIWADHPFFDEALRSVIAGSLGSSWEEITERLCAEINFALTIDAVRNRAGRLGLARPLATDSAAAAVTAARLKALRLAESRDLATAVKAQGKWEDFLDIVRGELLLANEPPSRLIPSVSSGSPETMVVLISDAHVGKLVRTDDVGPGFTYDKTIFEARGRALAEGVLRLREIHGATRPLPKLVLVVAGDMVDGVDMRRGHGLRVDIPTAVAQTTTVARYLNWLVQELLPYFPAGIEIIFETGNHGRVGEWGVALPSDSWDYVASLMVQANLEGLDGVTVDVHPQKSSIHEIAGLTVYTAHGDQIKGGGSSPVVFRHVAALQNLHRRRLDLVLLGHFHNSAMLTAGSTKILLNGAWDAGDTFSVGQLIAASDPVQWALGIHPQRGVSWAYELALAPKRAPTPSR